MLNGRVAREAGFERVFVPAWPGDEGIAMGCAAFALHRLAPPSAFPPRPLALRKPSARGSPTQGTMKRSNLIHRRPPPRRAPLGPYQGKRYSDEDVQSTIDEMSPWCEEVEPSELSAKVTPSSSPADAQGEEGVAAGGAAAGGAAVAAAVEALARGEVICWFDGRAEVGARALGSRCILADPRRRDMHARVNEVKRREMFRPLAPSVMAEEVQGWFDGVPPLESSPYMSITASVRTERRKDVPAITHVDGSARLQSVAAADAPLYYALIAAFFLATGVPLVLNTSFNLAGMPIVETPLDAVRCFLDAPADLSLLYLQGRLLRRRAFPAPCAASCPQQEPSFVSRCMADALGEPRRVEVLVEGRWLQLTDALELEVLERCSGGVSVAEIAAEIASEAADDEGTMLEPVKARMRHLYELRLVSMG